MLTWEALTEPAGELTPALFAGDSPAEYQARLTGYLGGGYVRTAALPPGEEQDRGAAAAGYAAAYHALYLERLAEPASANIKDAGGEAYLWQQIEAFRLLRDEKLAELDDVLLSLLVEGDARAGTVTVPLVFAW